MRVLYFAWVREAVGAGEESIDPPAGTATVADLIDTLRLQSDGHARAFADCARVRVAIDQRMAALDDSIAGAREIAFFPPVTGG